MCKLEVEKCVSSKKKNVEAQSSKVESKRCHLHIMHATHICINLKCTRRCTQEKLNVEVEAARQQSSKVTMCTQKSRKVEKQQSSKMVESKMGAAARSCSPPTRASDSRHSPTQLLSSSSTASHHFRKQSVFFIRFQLKAFECYVFYIVHMIPSPQSEFLQRWTYLEGCTFMKC